MGNFCRIHYQGTQLVLMEIFEGCLLAFLAVHPRISNGPDKASLFSFQSAFTEGTKGNKNNTNSLAKIFLKNGHY